MITLSLDPVTGKATLKGLTAQVLGAATPEQLAAIAQAITNLQERVDTLETPTTKTYTVELVP